MPPHRYITISGISRFCLFRTPLPQEKEKNMDDAFYAFTFKREEDDVTWTALLLRSPCKAPECAIMVSLTHPYCTKHLAECGFYIAPSTLPNAGMGLFVNRPFRKGSNLGKYGGIKISRAVLDHYYGDGTAPYAIDSHHPDVFYDGALKRTYVAMVNHSSGKKANCYFSGSRYGVKLKAARNLEKDEECLVSYGEAYDWKEQQHQTDRVG
jgi:hypothetical protein